MTGSNMHFSDYWRIIIKRKLIIISAAVLFLLISAAFAVWKAFPPLYSSACSIKFEKELTLEGLFARALSFPGGDNIEAQQAIITSYALLLDVAQNLSLISKTEAADEPEVYAVIQDLRNKIKVKTEKDAGILRIIVTDRNPAFAQRLANELAQTYTRQCSEQQEKQLNDVIKYINGQLKAVKDKLKYSEAQLDKFSQKHQLLSIKQQSANLLLRKKETEDAIRIETDSKKINSLKLELRGINEKINSLMDIKPEFDRLKREVESSRSMLSFLDKKNQDVMIKRAENPNQVEIVKPAMLSSRPVNQSGILRTCLLGLATGIALGLILAFLMEIPGDSSGIIEEIEKYLDIKIMGVIPRTGIREVLSGMKNNQGKGPDQLSYNSYINLVSHFSPKTMIAESFRALRTNILFAGENENTGTIAVTSTIHREGKSMVSVNLAISLAQAGLKTLLVGADLKNPALATMFSVEESPGLTDILLGTSSREDAIKTVSDMIMGGMSMDDIMMTPGLDNLNIITSGAVPEKPAELLNSRTFTEFLEDTEKEYDIIILDSAPVLSAADAAILGARAHSLLIVHMPGLVSKRMLKRTAAQLKQVKCNIMGIVLNGVKPDMIPAELRNKYSRDHSVNASPTGHEAASEKIPGKNLPVRILVTLAAVGLLASGIWWQRGLIFPVLFSSSEKAEQKSVVPPAQVLSAPILPEKKNNEGKKEPISPVEKPEAVEHASATAEPIENVEKAASISKEARLEYPEGRYPYSIYLGSYKNTERAETAIREYTRKGIPCFWVKVNFAEKGTWYRVYFGYYPDAGSASAFIEENKIKDAGIKKTAYACLIGSFTDAESPESRINLLKEKQYSPYLIYDDASRLHYIFAGAFITRGAAEALSAKLKADGIENRVVSR